MGDVLAYLLQSCVAAVFVLSAAWKLRHRAEFRAALAAIPLVRPLVPALVVAVPTVEVAVAALLLVPGAAGRVGAAAACVLTLALSATILRRDLSVGCGCWSAAGTRRGSLLVRNTVVFVFAVVAALLPSPAPSAALAVLVPIGALLALVIMEIPSILHAVDDAEGAMS